MAKSTIHTQKKGDKSIWPRSTESHRSRDKDNTNAQFFFYDNFPPPREQWIHLTEKGGLGGQGGGRPMPPLWS